MLEIYIGIIDFKKRLWFESYLCHLLIEWAVYFTLLSFGFTNSKMIMIVSALQSCYDGELRKWGQNILKDPGKELWWLLFYYTFLWQHSSESKVGWHITSSQVLMPVFLIIAECTVSRKSFGVQQELARSTFYNWWKRMTAQLVIHADLHARDSD